MKMKKGLKCLFVSVMAASVMLVSGITVSAEPDEPVTDPGEVITEPVEQDEPADNDNSVEEPVTDDPADDEPVTDDPADSEPVTDDPADDEPEPPAEESSEYTPDIAEQPDEESPAIIPDEPGYIGDESAEPPYEESFFADYDVNNEDYYVEYGNDNEYEFQPEIPQNDTSSLDISDYEVSDLETLTSEDWEELKKEQGISESSSFSLKKTAANGNNDPFAKLKGESTGGNDDWVYLAWGLTLIGAGVLAIAAVVIAHVYSKRRAK